MMSLLCRRICLGGIALLLAAPLVAADRVADLVRIHVEAIGGAKRIEALASLRASGAVIAGGKTMRFNLLAARPDKVRLETEGSGRSLVQGYDGQNPPWEFDTGKWPPTYHDMAASAAKVFVDDAEFDDPLVGGAKRGFEVEYAGEVASGGKKLIRLLVTHKLTETFAVLLDPDTYFVVRRIEDRKNLMGGTSHIVTEYSDFRPVDGVLLPHLIAVGVDGRAVQQTKIESIEPNPQIASDAFTRPQAGKEAE